MNEYVVNLRQPPLGTATFAQVVQGRGRPIVMGPTADSTEVKFNGTSRRHGSVYEWVEDIEFPLAGDSRTIYTKGISDCVAVGVCYRQEITVGGPQVSDFTRASLVHLNGGNPASAANWHYLVRDMPDRNNCFALVACSSRAGVSFAIEAVREFEIPPQNITLYVSGFNGFSIGIQTGGRWGEILDADGTLVGRDID